MSNYCLIHQDNPETFERCKTCIENTASSPDEQCKYLETTTEPETMSHPIFIPSKNRLNNCNFIKYLSLNNTHATIVVENEDYESYKKEYPKFNFLVLPESNQGITYVRNFIKQYTEESNLPFYWLIDDDVTSFYKRVDARMVRMGIEALALAEEQLKGYALGSLDYQQLAWSATKDHNENSFCDVCVLVDNNKTKGLRYRQEVEGKEDRDFAMQVIRAGHKTARTTLYAFGAPSNGTNAGGLKEIFYDLKGREELCADRMVKLWGEDVCIKIVKESGRVDVKIRWNKINSPQASLF